MANGEEESAVQEPSRIVEQARIRAIPGLTVTSPSSQPFVGPNESWLLESATIEGLSVEPVAPPEIIAEG